MEDYTRNCKLEKIHKGDLNWLEVYNDNLEKIDKIFGELLKD